MANPNGNSPKPVELKQDRVTATLRDAAKEYHDAANERDALQRQVVELKADLVHAKVNMDAQAGQMADMESKVETARLQRDQAIADRAKYEALFITFQAQLRAFAVPAAPLVRAADEQPAIE
jgi:predicted  nucleic acid-binding Zn-ribbon protein